MALQWRFREGFAINSEVMVSKKRQDAVTIIELSRRPLVRIRLITCFAGKLAMWEA